ncbi:MAG: hypothetical protein JWN84_2604 [Nocardioides sp.]|nr:hypothetical protein [Nocardioides sp.]
MRHRTILCSTAALAVAAGLAVGVPAPATAAVDQAPTAEGATWLVSQLTDDLVFNPNFGGFVDFGLSIDVGLALDAVDRAPAQVAETSDALAAQIDGYITGEAFGDAGSTYANSVAKALTFAQAAGDDPRSYGGVDLVSRLEGRVATTGDGAGRISDVSTFGDNANIIGQSFAARGLDAAGSTLTEPVTDYLLASQCSAGFFTLALSAPGAAPACPAGAGPSTDVTALAALNLLSQVDDTDVDAVVDEAAAWLVSTQNADGSFGSDAMIATANANSTGLAGWLLGEVGGVTNQAAAEKAAVWLRSHQVVNAASCTPYAAADEGAIAYDDAALASVAGSPITVEAQDQFRRATAQALPALRSAPDGVTSEITSRQGFVRAGSVQRVDVAASPGDLVCIAGPGVEKSTRVDADGEVTFSVRLPSGTATRAYRVSDGDEALGTSRFRALGAKRLKVTAPTAVASGRKVVLTATGLAPGEKATFKVDGRKRGTDVAGSQGRATLTVRVTGPVGRTPVVVTGAFADIRKGATAFRLTR